MLSFICHRHVKDLIILTVIVQGLGIFTDYMWLFWLLVRAFLFFLLSAFENPCSSIYKKIFRIALWVLQALAW